MPTIHGSSREAPFLLALLTATLLSPAATRAQQAATESGVITLDQLVVTGVGHPEPLSKIASTVQVIDTDVARQMV